MKTMGTNTFRLLFAPVLLVGAILLMRVTGGGPRSAPEPAFVEFLVPASSYLDDRTGLVFFVRVGAGNGAAAETRDLAVGGQKRSFVVQPVVAVRRTSGAAFQVDVLLPAEVAPGTRLGSIGGLTTVTASDGRQYRRVEGTVL